MRNVYITIIVLLALCITSLVASFFWLDKIRHKIFYYTVELEKKPFGFIKTERFLTEDRLMYKSAARMPFEHIYTDRLARLALNKDYILDEYSENNSGSGSRERCLIRNINGSVSLVHTEGPRFSYMEKMPVKKGVFLFKDDSLATYVPLIENYDFRKGGPQGFRAIVYFDNRLPPTKKMLTLRSIKDEYLKVDHRMIKAECLLLRAMGMEQIVIWVSKLDHSIVMIGLPYKNLVFTRSLTHKKYDVQPSAIRDSENFISTEVMFKNKKISLSGTLTVPVSGGPFPAVLLIPGSTPCDRGNYGIFTDIARHLTGSGFAVLRFDRRGIGASSGDFASLSDEEELTDLKSALEFMAGQGSIDSNRLFLIGHSKGSYLASKLVVLEPRIKGLAMMAGPASLDDERDGFKKLKLRSLLQKWPDEYLQTALQSRLDTLSIVKNNSRPWTTLLGRKCYLENMRQELRASPIEAMKNVKSPVLLLHGTNDAVVPSEDSSLLDKALEESGNSAHKLIYFGYLDHYFGRRVFDGQGRVSYRVDKSVLDTIAGWLTGQR